MTKIDVEGTEHAVPEGAADTLARRPAPTWLVEVSFSENFPSGVNPHFRDVFERFWSAGYRARSLDADRAVQPDDVERWLRHGRRDFGYVSYTFEAPIGE